jgi:hypothetical protein
MDSYNLPGVRRRKIIKDVEEDEKITKDDRRALEWNTEGLVVELKLKTSMDPFYTHRELELHAEQRTPQEKANNTPVAFEKPGTEPEITRGQMMIYATEAFAHQPSLHLFQILVCGKHARFLFFDHSGVIVSDAFNYTSEEGSRLMARFIWTYNHMSSPARGWDNSVQPATAEEKTAFKSAMDEFLKNMNDFEHPQRLIPHAEDTINPSYPILRVTVENELFDDSGELTGLGDGVEVIVQRPFFRHFSAIGRATRGYIAYHLKERRLMFLKDTWRLVHHMLTPERLICTKLKSAGNRYVPEVLCGGDVRANGEHDATQCESWLQFQTLPVGHGELRQFKHYRMLQELLYPVWSAKNSRETVIAFYHCLMGECMFVPVVSFWIL